MNGKIQTTIRLKDTSSNVRVTDGVIFIADFNVLVSFLVVGMKTDGSQQITVLSSGPIQEIETVFPLGAFQVWAEIYDEAGAYKAYEIAKHIDLLMPSEEEYINYDIKAKVANSVLTGEQSLQSQLVLADVSEFLINRYVLIHLTSNTLLSVNYQKQCLLV